MKLCIVVADEQMLSSAGVRIRYERIIPYFQEQGHVVSIRIITSLQNLDEVEDDIFLFCKCYDAQAIILAEMLANRGALVGVDLFDDYFSQSTNANFVRLRMWIREMATLIQFALCSTPRMLEVIKEQLPSIPGHIVNDPQASLELDRLAKTLEANAERARTTRRIDVAWFGMGDNSYFNVGLKDLAAFAPLLHQCHRSGYAPHLRILTNRRALVTDTLELIARAGIPFEIDEWTEGLEAELIANSLVSFLPVNAQSFSAAKSLNRAVTALTGGSQVLSVGFPLYAELDAFLYRQVDDMLQDVEAGKMRLRRETLPALSQALEAKASPRGEAQGLLAFLEEHYRERAVPRVPAAFVVLQGRNSRADVHRQAAALGHLTVETPFTMNKGLPADVRFVTATEGGSIDVLLSRQAAKRVPRHIRNLLMKEERFGKQPVRRLSLAALKAGIATGFNPENGGFLTSDLARYDRTMRFIADILRMLFGDVRVVTAENDAPFWVDLSSYRPVPSALVAPVAERL